MPLINPPAWLVTLIAEYLAATPLVEPEMVPELTMVATLKPVLMPSAVDDAIVPLLLIVVRPLVVTATCVVEMLPALVRLLVGAPLNHTPT